MIWFGKLAGLVLPAPARTPAVTGERAEMQKALETVATTAPHLSGSALVDALAATGHVDAATAARLLPSFGHFNADRFFADHMRRMSFRGVAVAAEFRMGVARVLEDLVGSADVGEVGPEEGVRFRHADREGLVLAYPEVAFSIGSRTRAAVGAAIEEMPDALVIVARNFQPTAADQLSGILARTGVPGTLITVNLLLGIRALTLRYQPPTEHVFGLLGAGRALRSADTAMLGDPAATSLPRSS